MCFRQPQQISLLLPVHATFSGHTDHSQAFKHMILKFKLKSAVTGYIPATVLQLDSVIYSNMVSSYMFRPLSYIFKEVLDKEKYSNGNL